MPNTMAAIEPMQHRKPTNAVISDAIASPLVPGGRTGCAGPHPPG